MRQRVDIIIRGRVQNVGFRYYAQKTATRYDICGLAKNQRDGSVYIEAEGEAANLKEFVAWCHTGPPWAEVVEVLVNPAPLSNIKGFHVH